MPLRYTITIAMLFMILAFSRGFVLQNIGQFSSFDALHALAEGDGGGGAGGGGDGGGGAGGGGDGAGGAGGGGDGAGGAGGAGGGGGGAGGADAPILGCMDSTATNYNPAATSQTGVICTYPTPECIIATNPTTIVRGGRNSVAWGFTNDVTSVSIDNGIGVQTTRGFTFVSPSVSTTYTGIATSPYGSATCSASVIVTEPSPILGCMDSTATNYNPAATTQTGITCTYPAPAVAPPAPVFGCMDSTATNYNPAATSQTGITCTYPVVPPPPPAPVFGCMDSTATNYNPAATSQTGITCTFPVVPPPPVAPVCTLVAAPASITVGASSVLSWTTTNATTFSIDNSIGSLTPVASGTSTVSPAVTTTYTGTATGAGGSATCTATITVTPPPPTPPPPGGGAGGPPATYTPSGGGSVSPTITLAVLPHVTAQPLAYLYLSQIPYTGLDLGPIGTMLYWLALIVWALALAYMLLFGAVPLTKRSLRDFVSRVLESLNARESVIADRHFASAGATLAAPPVPVREPHIVVSESGVAAPEAPRGYSTYDGFKSFAQKNGALSVDDIVKSLSRRHPATTVSRNVEPIVHAEPVYENVEPIYEQVETIVDAARAEMTGAPASVRGFIAALVEGDRVAVFAGLRQHVRGAGAPEQLISDIVCVLDDVYRARIDGSVCDADIARLTARLSTPTLEKLVAALTTAIDSSYSTGVTGAKLALTRALAVLGA